MTMDTTTGLQERVLDEGGNFVHDIRVRYGECDQQGIVFNSHYLAYIDHALGRWFKHALDPELRPSFDCMVKKVELEWFSPAKPRDIIALRPRTTRWGTTSFDVTVDGSVEGRPTFSAKVIYVSVTPGTHTPCPTPEFVRESL